MTDLTPNYDPEDEQHFYDQATWGVFQSYHKAVLADLLALLPNDAMSILDVGCGDGLLTNELPLDRDVVGVDISPVALKFVKRRALVGSALDLPFEDNAFDLVMANDVVEHFTVENRARALAEIERVARKYVIITTPFTEKLVHGYRAEPRGRHHVNRHFDSFDVATVAGFFESFRMSNCVFSGDEWEDELMPIEYMKRAHIGASASARRFAGAVPRLDATLERLRTRQAAYLCEHPDMVDMLRRRTEIMALYETKDNDSAAGRLDDQAIDWNVAHATGEAVDLLEVQGGALTDRLSTILPLSSRLPYVVCASPIEQTEDGYARVGDAGIIDLKFGFFAPIAHHATLLVRMRLQQPSSAAINVFDPVSSYRNLYRADLPAGEIELTVAIEDLPVCQYGYLFQLVVDTGPLDLKLLRIGQADRPTRTRIAPGPNYISRQVGNVNLYTGLDLTGRLAPLWFEAAEKYPASPADLLEAPAAIESLIIETALLQATREKSVELLDERIRVVQPEAREADQRIEQLHARISAMGREASDSREAFDAAVDRLARELKETREAHTSEEADQRIEQLHARISAMGREASDSREAFDAALDRLARELKETREAHTSEIVALAARTGQLRSRVDALEPLYSLVETLGNRLSLVERTTRILRAPRAIAARARAAIANRRVDDGAASPSPNSDQTARPQAPARADGLPHRITMLVPDDRIDRRVLLEGRTLHSHGVEVTVIAVPYPGEVDLDQQQFPELEIVRIDTSRAASVERDLRTGRLADHDFDWKGVYFYTHQFLEAALARPADLVVAHDLPVLPAAIAAADLLGARLFYDAHELYPEQHHFGAERIELYRAVEQALIAIPDQVATVNQSIAEEMSRRYGIAEPLVILNAPDGSGRDVPYPPSSLLRDAFPIGPDTKILLFQGSLSLNRNLETLVEAMALVRTRDLVLVVMGPGDAKRRELKGMAQELGLLGTRIFFHDAVPQTELLTYTAGADIGIIPYPSIDINTTLCTPNKLFEFFVAGIPILANDLPELRRFVLGKGAGITHAMDTAAQMAAGIDLMAASDLSALRTAVAAGASGMTWQAQEPMVVEAYRRAMLNDRPSHDRTG